MPMASTRPRYAMLILPAVGRSTGKFPPDISWLASTRSCTMLVRTILVKTQPGPTAPVSAEARPLPQHLEPAAAPPPAID
jgi:hypothetical protein